ncbi:oxidoreductase [Duffyella gerundensis]|uniref:oxidoreductase n=1 Tax=Duffyella gerundensis TaxID=1619313 RepID=UPI001CE2C86B|nr:oxidoreductase [Duffyella gerundensis]UCB32851.1 oxidoreductase [Duffyella gerundensis]
MTNIPVALVTGASSGIGEACARQLAAAGYCVYGTSRRADSQSSGAFTLLPLDVTDEQSVDAVIKEVIAREGRIDLLINNAGFGIAPAAAEESSVEQAWALFDTNFMGIVRMTCAVVPHMRRQGSGRIINIGSILGVIAMPYVALYAASKHAVEGYSEALDHELRTQGIRVSVIEPAYTKTAFDTHTIAPDRPLAEYSTVRASVTQTIRQAMNIADTPDDVAQVVVRVAQTGRPKIRYTAGKAAAQLAFLRRFALSRVLDKGVRKNLQLDQVRKS